MASFAPLSRAEMTKHIRKRLRVEGVPARVFMESSNHVVVAGVKHDSQWTRDEREKIIRVLSVNRMLDLSGGPVDFDPAINHSAYAFRVPAVSQ